MIHEESMYLAVSGIYPNPRLSELIEKMGIAQCHNALAEPIEKDIIYPSIFCDIDEVLTDFTSALRDLYRDTSGIGMQVGIVPAFNTRLPFTTDGRKLWKLLQAQPNSSSILTGRGLVGREGAEGREIARHDNRSATKTWCEQNLRKCEVNVTKHWLKHTYCQEPGSILIDENILSLHQEECSYSSRTLNK